MRRTQCNEQVSAWLADLARRGRKESTIESYAEVVMRHLRFLERNGYSPDAERIGVEEIAFLYANLPGNENTRRSELRQLANFIVFTTGADPVKKAGLLYNRETVNRVWLEPADFRKMMEIADPTERLILVLGGYMGLRRSEIAGLRDSDIDSGYLIVRGKGHGRDGLVSRMPMPRPVVEEIASFMLWRAPYSRTDDHLVQMLFVTYRELRPVSPHHISDCVRKLGERVEVKATAHSLRRMYGTVMYHYCGVDPATLKDLMRHASINTTFKCYINGSEKKRKEAMDAFEKVMEET